MCVLVGITDVKLHSDLHFLAGTDGLRWDHSESLAAAVVSAWPFHVLV